MRLPSVNLSGEQLSRIDEALRNEWLLTNGLGGYASSTVLGINTRKYHGLLVAALEPPRNRTVCLGKLDEDLSVGSNVYPLGANEFQDKIYPQGYLYLKAFSVSPFPTYVYEAESVEVKKTVFMPQEKNAVAAIYEVKNGGNSEVTLQVYPMLTCRHFHSVVDRHRDPFEPNQHSRGKQVEVAFSTPKTTILVSITEGEFVEKPNWIDRLRYREEASRGESSIDDCYQPGYFEIHVLPLHRSEFAIITAADENPHEANMILKSMGATTCEVRSLLGNELKQQTDRLSKFYQSRPQLHRSNWLSWINMAANTFVVKNSGDGRSVIAGYHWFEAWGRDTFISLPGLLLANGRTDDARRVLLSFIKNVREGLIPNFMPEKSGEPAYNTVDATLWYVNSVLQFLKYTGDFGFVRENLWEALKTILDSHIKGTLFGIRLDSDGLLTHGPQLTWMDAELDGKPVTPRAGKAVEVQALWYNALKTVELLAGRFKDDELRGYCRDAAAEARRSFNVKFWNEEKNCLFDVVGEAGADASLRPNQIIAAALDFAIVDRDKAERLVEIVQRELLTRCGLRTLNTSDMRYRGVYAGDRRSRDQAYHNGTVWAWLTGPFTTAFLKTKGQGDYLREHAAATFIMPLFSQQILQAGLGTVSEVFDGDSPHTPRGCISQAWSVAEPLRAYVEDIMQVKPEHARDVLPA